MTNAPEPTNAEILAALTALATKVDNVTAAVDQHRAETRQDTADVRHDIGQLRADVVAVKADAAYTASYIGDQQDAYRRHAADPDAHHRHAA